MNADKKYDCVEDCYKTLEHDLFHYFEKLNQDYSFYKRKGKFSKIMAFGGGVAGIAVGIALPAILGFEVGEYVQKNYLNFSETTSYFSYFSAAFHVLSFYYFTVPAMVKAGIHAGGKAGNLIDKKNLESIIES
jgi:hypothetical protein